MAAVTVSHFRRLAIQVERLAALGYVGGTARPRSGTILPDPKRVIGTLDSINEARRLIADRRFAEVVHERPMLSLDKCYDDDTLKKWQKTIKGGVVVDIGIPAFMPASQTDVRPMGDVDPWLNQEISVRVIKMNRKRGNVVVSRRGALERLSLERRSVPLDAPPGARGDAGR